MVRMKDITCESLVQRPAVVRKCITCVLVVTHMWHVLLNNIGKNLEKKLSQQCHCPRLCIASGYMCRML